MKPKRLFLLPERCKSQGCFPQKLGVVCMHLGANYDELDWNNLLVLHRWFRRA